MPSAPVVSAAPSSASTSPWAPPVGRPARNVTSLSSALETPPVAPGMCSSKMGAPVIKMLITALGVCVKFVMSSVNFFLVRLKCMDLFSFFESSDEEKQLIVNFLLPVSVFIVHISTVTGRISQPADFIVIIFIIGSVSGIPQCYSELNVDGQNYGNCGYNRGNFLPCDLGDVLCGQLQCADGQFTHGDVPGSLTIFTRSARGDSETCRSFTTSPTSDTMNPGLVADGTRCGNASVSCK